MKNTSDQNKWVNGAQVRILRGEHEGKIVRFIAFTDYGYAIVDMGWAGNSVETFSPREIEFYANRNHR